MINPIFPATVEEGKLNLKDKDAFLFYASTLSGDVELIIRKKKKHRSTKENNYYWGVIIKLVGEEMGNILPSETHDFLRGLFLIKGIKVKGKQYEIIRSTADLSTVEFEDYLSKIRMWGSEELSCYIPLPNEVEI